MEVRTAARLGWSAFALAVVLSVAEAVFVYLARDENLPNAIDLGVVDVAVGFAFLVFPAVGALVLARNAHHPVAWMYCAAGIVFALSGLAQAWATRAVIIDAGSLPAGTAAAWLATVTSVIAVPLLATLAVLLLPNGQLLSSRWRPVAWITAVSLAAIALYVGLQPGPLQEFEPVENPLGVGRPGAAWDAIGAVYLMLPLSAVAAAISLFARFRRSRGEERVQLEWVAAGVGLLAAALVSTSVIAAAGGSEELFAIPLIPAILGFAGATGVAVLRYRLFELDLVINRALVYFGLTLMVLAIYIGLVSAAGALLDSSGLGISILATGVVAVLVIPLRLALQTRVNQLMYGDRDDPYRALTRLGERLDSAVEPDAVLPSVVEAVSQALRLPYVAVELERDGRFERVAAYGEEPPRELLRLPLTYQGATIGHLVAGPRSDREPITGADRRLLEDLARQAGVAAHSVRLTGELRRSREQLVVAREEERRRFRRDLHDGLGPSLAGVALELETARGLAVRDPKAAGDLLSDAKAQLQGAIADIRRLVHDLRPPALDELGLVPALREHAGRLGRTDDGRETSGPLVRIEEPEKLPTLPAAVEVAAYRIALEAVTNASRHSRASTCVVRLAVEGELELEVQDDGVGVDAGKPWGVGLSSMRERAEELGGDLSISEPSGGGTLVRARLPMGGG